MQKPTPIDEEYTFEKGLIISSTNLDGIITYANRKFCEIAGYTKKELIAHSHNIVRHPDMPQIIFKELWDTIRSQKEWTGVVKNLRSDGKFYWVYSHITPIISNGAVTGYNAVRRPASKTEKEESIPLYAKMLKSEND